MLGHVFSRKEIDLMLEAHETAIEDLTERLGALVDKLGLEYDGEKYKKKTVKKKAVAKKAGEKRPVGRPRKTAK